MDPVRQLPFAQVFQGQIPTEAEADQVDPRRRVDGQRVHIPQGVCAGLDDAGFDALYQASIVHAKPLTNALGADFKSVLTPQRVRALFEQM